MIREGWNTKPKMRDYSAYCPLSGHHWVAQWRYNAKWYVYDAQKANGGNWFHNARPDLFHGPYAKAEDAFLIAEALNLLEV